jgi:hypothetical protein
MGATQDDIALHFNLDPNTVARILRGDRTDRLSPETVATVLEYAHQVGFDFTLLRSAHQRRHQRFNVSIAADANLTLRSGTVFDSGKVTVVNLSMGGARMRVENMPKRSLPIDPSSLRLKVTQAPLAGLQIDTRPVRLHHQDPLVVEIGIEFLPMAPEIQAVLDRYLDGFRRKGGGHGS